MADQCGKLHAASGLRCEREPHGSKIHQVRFKEGECEALGIPTVTYKYRWGDTDGHFENHDPNELMVWKVDPDGYGNWVLAADFEEVHIESAEVSDLDLLPDATDDEIRRLPYRNEKGDLVYADA